MELSIICVNWNSVKYLTECIASIYENTRGLEFEIIVVDNASPDGNVDTLHDAFPDVKIIKSSENLGFSRANNLGFRHSSGEYVLFLNPDTKLVGPAIQILVEHIRKLDDAGIVGCKLLNSDLSIQTQSIQRFPTILNQLLNVECLRLKWPNCRLWAIGPLFDGSVKPVQVEVIPGALMLMKRAVFENAGMFTEEYFMYAEDLDLNYKVGRLGYKRYYIGNAVIIHHGGGSSTQQRVSQWSTIMKFRAMTTLFRRNRSRAYSILYRATQASGAAGRLILLAAALPVAALMAKGQRVRWASEKWTTVLMCALGMKRVQQH